MIGTERANHLREVLGLDDVPTGEKPLLHSLLPPGAVILTAEEAKKVRHELDLARSGAAGRLAIQSCEAIDEALALLGGSTDG